ncbi:MAG: T9SS type A sorting domain-containing protein [Ignavibacterium album]|uniref:YCF48-related protein n=1 Tax=Ignavibacterium album TaxID=591197 RepID=UPI0026EE7EB1|nr:YCF48-related protein [Ignavibacterium album]MBI5661133.1 T9SS type A sorting domain-containing protein [Ignavibacterium album]
MRRIILISLLIPFLKISAQWTNVNPVPSGNDIWSSFFSDDSTGWIVGSDGLIKRTTNQGEDWIQQISNTSKTLKSVRFVNQEYGFICGSEGLILKTTNGGDDWLQIFSGINDDLTSLSIVNENLVFIVGHNGVVLRTTNGGVSWYNTTIDSTLKFKSVCFTDDTTGFIVSLNAKVFKTIDGGISWTDVSPLLDPDLYRFNSVFFINPDTGWIGAGNDYSGTGVVFYTTDGGMSWTQNFSMKLGYNKTKITLTETTDDSYGIRQIFFIDSLKGYAVAGTGYGWARTILATTNGGLNWTVKYATLEENGLLSVHVSTNGFGIATGFNGSIFRTTDFGSSWYQTLSGGLKYGGEENLFTITFISDSIGFAGGSRGSFNYYGDQILKTTNGGKIWITNRYNYSSYNKFNAIYFINDLKGWAGSDSYLFFTTDAGITWNQNNTVFYNIKSVFFINESSGWVANESSLQKSSDGGINFFEVSTSGGNSIFFANDSIGWVAGDNGSLRKTTDGGETWITKSIATTSNLNSIKFRNLNLGALCGDNGTLLITTDGGETWLTRITNTSENLTSLIFKDDNSIWCVGNNGLIIESNDLGITWIVHSNITDKNISAVTLKPDNSIFIAGEKGLMFRYTESTSPTVPHFTKIWQGNPYLPMNIYITSASVDSVPLKAGDEIAVFSGNNCVGTVSLSAPIPSGGFVSLIASMDDPTTPEIDGFVSNDTIIFRLWDSQNLTEIEFVEINYAQGTGRFVQQGTAVVSLSGRLLINQVIGLTGGWNIISFNTEPLNKNLLSVFEPLITSETLVKVQDETGNAIEKLPPPIGWINNIGDWSVTEGYYTKIQQNTSANLINTGFKISLPLDIPLTAGWNIISYPLQTEQNAVAILQDLINSNALIKVQDEQGNAIEYLPPPIGWINNIGNFKPGEGYYVKVNQNSVLTYNLPLKPAVTDKKMIVASENVNSDQNLNTAWTGNPYLPMNIYIIGLNNQYSNNFITAGDEIGIFDGNVCVGVNQISNYNLTQGLIQIITSADDPTTITQDGFIAGNPILLKLWDNETNQIIDINNLTLVSGSSLFEPLGTSVYSFENVVPVELKSFEATVKGNIVELNWSTASESNNRGFEIERSQKSEVKSQMDWETSGFVEGSGTTTETQNYSFVDKKLSTGKYAYRLKQIDVDGAFKYSNEIEVDITAPNEFALYQNYPNPFNPSTKISWQSPVGSWQTLKVFDILGNEVATLVDEFKEPGIYEVEFDASNLTSGVYVYRLKTEGFIITRKMVLLR